MKFIKKHLLTSLLVFGFIALGVMSFSPVTVSALDAKAEVCGGLDQSAGTTNCGSGTGQSVPELIGTVISILTIIVGAVSVIMIIIGGFRYVVSNGDSNGVQGAKNTIIYAVVGLVIALSAQLLVAFVINKS